MCEIAKTVDARNLSCPLPIIKAKKAISDVPIGKCLEILATDPGSKNDFPSWCNATGHELISSTEENGYFKYVIKRIK